MSDIRNTSALPTRQYEMLYVFIFFFISKKYY